MNANIHRRRLLRGGRWLCAGGLLFVIAARSAQASFHLWSVNELYSNADGSVQYVEFSTSFSDQEFLQGHTITCVGPLGTHSYTFPSNLPSGTANKTFIVGTANLPATPGGLKPDYVFTNSTPFLFLNAGVANTVTLVGASTVSAVYTNLPTDGVRSLIRTSGSSFRTVVTNSPKNYFNQSNTIVPVRFVTAALGSTNILISFATASGTNATPGPNYAVQTNGDFTTANWATFTNVVGNGTLKTIAVPFDGSQRFFRLRVP